jgi:hypothetical protein
MLKRAESTDNRWPGAGHLGGVAVPTLISPRSAKGFADGFGGACIGGIVYWAIGSALGGSIATFPWLQVSFIAMSSGLFEAYRVARN